MNVLQVICRTEVHPLDNKRLTPPSDPHISRIAAPSFDGLAVTSAVYLVSDYQHFSCHRTPFTWSESIMAVLAQN